MSTCPHCGGDTARRPLTLTEIIGVEAMRRLVEAEQRAAERALAAKRASRRRALARRRAT